MTERSIADALTRVLDSFAGDLHVALPGVIRAYDTASQTATIELGALRVVPAEDRDVDEDSTESLPILQSVPVAWPRAGAFFLHFPLDAGDSVIVLFSESDLNAWRQSGGVVDPGIGERHGLGGAVAIPGLYPRASVVGSADGTYGRVGHDNGPFVEFRPSEIRAGGSLSLSKATLVDDQLNDLKTAIAGWTPVPNDGGAALKTALTSWLLDLASTGTSILKGA